MKTDEKTEKENTAKSMSEEKNPLKGDKGNKIEQAASRSGNNNNESAPENVPKKNRNVASISGKKTLFTFFLIVAIGAAGFSYLYRNQIITVLPNELVEFFAGSSEIAKIDTQESIQNEMGIDEVEKQDINSDITQPSIIEPTTDQTDLSAIDQYETDSSLRAEKESQLVLKDEKLEDEKILHSEKVSNKEINLDVIEDHEKILKVGNSDILAIVKELHKITVEIEGIDFTKNFSVIDNSGASSEYSNSETFSEKLLENLRGLIQIRKIKDDEDLSLSKEREKSLKNQFVINLISGKTMLITGFNAEALDDIRRARKILNLFYGADEENVTMIIGRLDEIIYQVKEMDR